MSPVVKKKFAKTCALDTFEKLLGDDLVGVYVRPIQRGDQSLVYAKRLHFVLSPHSNRSAEALRYPKAATLS
jgi:hypothetical protein